MEFRLKKRKPCFMTKMRVYYDSDHSLNEERYIILGISSSLRLIVVCHVYREENDIIRIISARKATKQEVQQYRRFSL